MSWRPKMVNMAQEREKPDEPETMPDYEGPRFPYGLALCLTDKELAKLGLEADCECGDTVHLFCMAKVTSVSCNENEGGKCSRVELQITDMGVESEDEENEEADMDEDAGEPKKSKRLYDASY